MEEETKAQLKQIVKKVVKIISRLFFPIILLLAVIVVFIAAFTYFITVDDGTYKEDDWSSTPYAAGTYVNGTTVNNDGTISTSTSAQELWDKMIQNGSRVNEYLDTPEELVRLMRAEIVTQYPDTRSNPDEPINWEKIIEEPDKLQGIIKFKRAKDDGSISTMSYVDPETFQGYIDEYNKTGSKTAKNNALNHFTLKKTSSSTTNGNGGAIAAGEGVMTDISQAIVNATNKTPWPGASLCSKWVNDVYDNAGVTAIRVNSAYDQSKITVISTDRTAIPIGAAVYGTGTGTAGGPYGHVGIYLGGGQVVDSVSNGIRTVSLEQWIKEQENYPVNSNNVLPDMNGNEQHGWLGWGWADGNKIRGTTQDPNIKENDPNNKTEEEKEEEDKIDKENKKKGTVVETEGDGYTRKYVSSAGITYTDFKQIEGSYKDNPYWSGTISSDGCGPTSLAILASGLTNLNYTPADVAQEMQNKFGGTSPEYLKQEMDSLGMPAEFKYSPSAEEIQDNLRNGKVMLVCVDGNTIYTQQGHLMALVDINEQGQVYILNPASNTLWGWTDISEIMKGCAYIVTTDAGAAGIASSSNTSEYTAVVATWKQIDTQVVTSKDPKDPKVEDYSNTQYSMTTTNINYEEMVDPYTMPFDLLWALLVTGESKGFVFELADLVYNSNIEITVHDNLTINTDIDNWTYVNKKKAVVSGTITATCGDKSTSGNVEEHPHETEDKYNTIKTVKTQSNTVNVALTRANVWIVDYKNEYTYSAPSETETTSTKTVKNQEYPSNPESTSDSYSCEEITAKKQELAEKARKSYNTSIEITETTGNSSATSTTITIPTVSYSENIKVEHYSKYINMIDNITNIVNSQKYISGTPDLKEKTDKKSKEPNFVTIFNKNKYEKNAANIRSASSWLFEILDINDSTSDMLDLIKYLLYKATGINYGIKEFDFSIFYPGQLITVGENDYIVDTTKSSSDIVIKDVETLKKAFSWYPNNRVLMKYADYFLECQEKYNVNAVFAAAVSITESSAGTNIAIGGNNMFSISNGGQGNWNSYGTMEGSIEAFFKLINKEYFGNGQYTVDSISRGNPPGVHMYCVPPDDWIKNTVNYMTEMFKTAGINISSMAGGELLDVAKRCHDYVRNNQFTYGATGNIPVSGKSGKIDCSGYVSWVLYEYGYKELKGHQKTTSTLYTFAKSKGWEIKKGSEAKPGDILLNPNEHTEIYAGNNQVYNCGSNSAIQEAIGTNNPSSFKYSITVSKP